MSRPWVIRVEDYAAYSDNRWYRVQVMQVEKNREPTGIRIVLRHVETEQLGRESTLIVPLPLRPGSNLGASFFAACDVPLAIKMEIAPKATIGRTILVRFDPSIGKAQAFKPAPEGENTHEWTATSAPGRPSDSATQTPEPDGNGSAGR